MAVPLFVLENSRRRVGRTRSLLEKYTDPEVKKLTGFSINAVKDLIDIFEPTCGQTAASIPVETKVLSYLSFLRSGTFQYILGPTSGVSQTSVSRIVEDCINLTITLTPSVIRFPVSVEEINNTKQRFSGISGQGFPNIIGLIDGTQIPIKAPSENEEIYVCRKLYHSINVQVISGPDNTFFDVVAKWPGSTHDSFIYNNSSIKNRISGGEFGEGWLLGDSGYPLEPRLLTPYSIPTTDLQRVFNEKHKKTRSEVERTIGILKSRFRALDRTGGSLCYKLTKCCKIIVAAATIHNICVTRSIPLSEEDTYYLDNVAIPTIRNENLGEPRSGFQRREGAVIRDRVAASFI